MTAMALQTLLTVVLVAWSWLVTSRVPYRRAWIWFGTALVVVVGYLALIARTVFEGSPARVQGVVGAVGGTLVAIAGVACLLLFAAVSAASGRTRVPSRGVAPADTGADDAEPVIIPEEDGPASVRNGSSPTVPEAGRRPGPRRAMPTDDT